MFPWKFSLLGRSVFETNNNNNYSKVDEPGVKKFSYPGIVFIRKMKDGNCFEFNIPMAITSRVITALEIMTKDGTSKNWNMRTETWPAGGGSSSWVIAECIFSDLNYSDNNNNNNNNWEKNLK